MSNNKSCYIIRGVHMKKHFYKIHFIRFILILSIIITSVFSNTLTTVFAVDSKPTQITQDPPNIQNQDVVDGLSLVYGNPDIDDEDACVFLIMGDGFKSNELDTFFEESKKTAEYIMNSSPYNEFKDVIKFYALGVISNESGAKGDHAQSYEEAKADTRDTYFESSFYTEGVKRFLTIDPTGEQKAEDLKNTYLPAADFNIIIVNSTTYGGSGGSVCVASLNDEAFEMMLHELGHTIANLADEYFEGEVYAEELANMSKESDPTKVRWSRFIGKNGVGLYAHDEGGENWYRPHEECKMRYLGVEYDFCEVCKEAQRDALCKNANVTSISFQTYADILRESSTPIDMKQYFILRKGSLKASGNEETVSNDLVLTYYDDKGENETDIQPTKSGYYQVKASFKGNSSFDSCEIKVPYYLDFRDIITLNINSKTYDSVPADLKYAIDYNKEYIVNIRYIGTTIYSILPSQTNTYDSEIAPTTPGNYKVTITAYDKTTNEIIGEKSVDFTIKFKTTAIANNNDEKYPGAQSYANNHGIVFVGEGFTALEQTKFETLAKEYYKQFKETEPYKESNLYFNYHTVQAISNESGISNPTISKDTYFGLSLDQNNKIMMSDLSTGAANYLSRTQISSYSSAVIVIINDDSIKGGTREDNNGSNVIYAGSSEEGMKYAIQEIINLYNKSPEGTDWMKDETSLDEVRQQLIKKLYFYSYGESLVPILSRAYKEHFIETKTAPDLASTFHTYINGIEVKDVSYKMTYFEDDNGSIGKKVDKAPTKAGHYYAHAELIPDNGKTTKTVVLNGEEYIISLARGITPYTIYTDKSSLNESINLAGAELAKENTYTVESLSLLKKALTIARTISNDQEATQTQIDDAYTQLQTAIQGLKSLDNSLLTKKVLNFNSATIPDISIEGYFSSHAYFHVENIKENSDVYTQLLKAHNQNEKVIGAYHLNINGESLGPYTITFHVAKELEGKKAIVYHIKDDGNIEKLKTNINNGNVVITVDSLSPFMISIEQDVKSSVSAGDTANSNGWLILFLFTGIVIIVSTKKGIHKQRNNK